MKKRFLLLPALTGIWAYSCVDTIGSSLSQHERDVRMSVCAFVVTVVVLLLASDIYENQGNADK